jgi:DNA-directed RNA polymerase specialized sigma54-like protein
MALSQRLEVRQSQALVMTPQLMQAIKLLQLSSLDLAAYVDGELERNCSDAPAKMRLAQPATRRHQHPKARTIPAGLTGSTPTSRQVEVLSSRARH